MINKKIIGYTTGVFDMFHIGHLNILKQAKKNCDYLIVGVSSDELVKSYKNKEPIIPFDDRIKIIEAIKYVDKVVPQTNRDKIEAQKKYKFDIMFVGDDWKGSELFDEIESSFKKDGIKIQYFEYTKNISSSKLKLVLEKIFKDDYL